MLVLEVEEWQAVNAAARGMKQSLRRANNTDTNPNTDTDTDTRGRGRGRGRGGGRGRGRGEEGAAASKGSIGLKHL